MTSLVGAVSSRSRPPSPRRVPSPRRELLLRYIQGSLSVVALLVLWSLLSVLLDTRYFPGPWLVADKFVQLSHRQLLSDVAASLKEALGGWLIGALGGIALGALIGRSPLLNALLKPVFNFLRHISPLAWVPLAILWFGIGYWSKTSVIVLISFFNLLVNTAAGMAGLDETILKAARSLQLPPAGRAQVVLYGALPDILVGLRFGLGAAWGGVVISELVAGNTGIGALELYGGQAFDVAQVMVGMALIALLGLAANAGFVRAQRRLFPWVVANRPVSQPGAIT